MTEDQAYAAYEKYVAVHKATTADPLRTFSGWILQFKIVIDEEERGII